MYVLEQVEDNRQKQPKKLIRPSNTLGSFRVYYDNVLCNCIYLRLNQQSIRAATSRSHGDSSFHEDLQQARCEFKTAPVRLAKLVSLAGDEKRGSNKEAVTTSDSPSDLQ